MTDRELLELAAKAADIRVGFDQKPYSEVPGAHWNPLEDDGDALRLAVRLRLDMHYEDQPGWVGELVEVLSPRDESGSFHCETHALGDDPYAATRRAIVRAAAEIGRLMP